MSKRTEPFESLLDIANKRIDDAVEMMIVPSEIGETIKGMFRCQVYQTLIYAANEADGWTKRCDDAKRIPDVLNELADAILKGKS